MISTKFTRLVAVATLTILCLTPLVAQGGEATSTGETVSPTPYSGGVEWYAARRAKILEAANAKIVESKGDGQFVVATQTELGTSTYLVQETTEVGDSKTVILLKYQRSLTGTIRGQSMTVTLTPQGEQTRVQLSLYAKIDHPLALSSKVKKVLDTSVQNTIAVLKKP